MVINRSILTLGKEGAAVKSQRYFYKIGPGA
jgi:hypothetical protein